MPIRTIEDTTAAERIALEQAIACGTQLRPVAATAPNGTVRAACAQVALDAGRPLLRDTLAAAVQARADAAAEKKVPRGPARAAVPAGTKDATPAGSGPPSGGWRSPAPPSAVGPRRTASG